MKIDYSWKSNKDFRKWGPYLSYGVSAGTEMIISWQSKFYSLESWIDYGETPECGNLIKKDCVDNPIALHSFKLSGLKPNTKYYFKISRVEDYQIDPTPVYSFETGPKDGEPTEFEFNVAGDIHAWEGNAIKTFSSMETNSPNAKFIISCGDAVTHGGDEEKWNDFFYEFTPFATKFVLMNTTGNHDTDHPETYAHFIQTFRHPYVNPLIGAYYYFIYGNAIFIMLDSTNAGQSVAMQGVISDEQMDWLESVLERFALKDYWVFIFMHHPIYSTGDSGIMNIYELAYKDLFDEYHVDAVFYGHDHHFEVYWRDRDVEWGGTHYFLVGNGGGDLGLFNSDPKRKPLPNYLWKGRTYIYERDGLLGGNVTGGIRNDEVVKSSYIYGVMEHGYTNLKVTGDELEIKMWGWQNKLYFKDKIKRTDCGKKYHRPEFMQEF
ncbi:MAG: metallophosphoesterase [Promethearchaeota archaeon]